MAKEKKRKKNKSREKSTKPDRPTKLTTKAYEKELERLQGELVKLQYWVKAKGHRAVVVFEGRDAAGKGGVIKRITERVSPRVFRVVALPAPTDREKGQLYIQRHMAHFPAAGEVILFDRSWYNRAGVERVMGFCTDDEYTRFLHEAPMFENAIVEHGVQLIKYWFDVGMDVQERRFQARSTDPRKIWKLSPMDVESYQRWYDYSRARDAMLEATDTEQSPWHIVRADNKKSARLNCIAHLLSQIPYEDLTGEEVELGKRRAKSEYDDRASMADRRFVPELY
jgi:polyphosphate kinase 2